MDLVNEIAFWAVGPVFLLGLALLIWQGRRPYR